MSEDNDVVVEALESIRRRSVPTEIHDLAQKVLPIARQRANELERLKKIALRFNYLPCEECGEWFRVWYLRNVHRCEAKRHD